MISQNLSQKMLQKLSPQQIQLMKLLQIPTATLEQRIKEELESNPALDEGLDDASGEEKEENRYGEDEKEDEENTADDFELDEYLLEYIEDDPGSYKMRGEHYDPDESDRQIPIPVENTFHEYLERQLGLLNLRDRDHLRIAKQIIGSIDEDGYLRRETEAIVDDLLFSQNLQTTEQEVSNLLKKIQRMEPPGVGARDLKECLILQLGQKKEALKKNDQKQVFQNARIILQQYFDEFSKKHYHKLAKYLDINEEDLKAAIDLILKLNPKPASAYTATVTDNTNYIIPDFIIVNRDGDLELNLNNKNAPDLRISGHYRDLLQTYKETTKGRKASRKEKEAIKFIKQKIDSAKWFIDAIVQRQHTMYKTMYSIMQYQYDYFLTGDERKLKPMILKDIADMTGLDISTVSRVANSKFVQTEFGTRRLKDFFSESITTQEGEEVSTLEVKNILTDIISKENKRKPLSDEKLKNMLLNKGYNIARRTVAKYREQLNIPVARLRKEL